MAWDNTHSPPTLVNPQIFDVSTHGETTVAAESQGGPGDITIINVDAGRDALITQSVYPHVYPVEIVGGDNIIVRGLDLAIITQPGNDIGQLPGPNIHPRCPRSKALKVSAQYVNWIEGCHIWTRGHEIDCMVKRQDEAGGQTVAHAKANQEIYIINSLFEDQRSKQASPNIHGDFIQNQGDGPSGRRVHRRMYIEGCTHGSIGNGITGHGDGGSGHGPPQTHLRRYNLRDGFSNLTNPGPYNHDDGPYQDESRGLIFDIHVPSLTQSLTTFSFEDVYIDDPRDNIYGIIRFGGINRVKASNAPPGQPGDATVEPGLIYGTPPGGDYATAATTGENYSSPFLQPPTELIIVNDKGQATLTGKLPTTNREIPPSTKKVWVWTRI